MFCDGYQESVGKDNATGIMQCMEKVQIWNKDNVKGQFRYLLEPSFPICIPFNPTLHGGGGTQCPPTMVLVSGAFQSYLSDPKCWHNSYRIFRISFMNQFFFSFLDNLNKQKDLFALLGQK